MEKVGAKGLSKTLISKICDLIVSWEGRLTWKLLVSRIEKDFNLVVSRQSLSGYFTIKKEFQIRKQQIREGKDNYRASTALKQSEQKLLTKIDAQDRKITSLEKQVLDQLNQLKRFVYNARNQPGVDLAQLNKPLDRNPPGS